MKRIAEVLLAAALALPAYADEAHHKKDGAAQGATQSEAMSEGEVRRVDKPAKKIILRHGPLQNLDMPGMTMAFQVADPAMLDQVKAGDKVKFRAEKVGASFMVTRIETVK